MSHPKLVMMKKESCVSAGRRVKFNIETERESDARWLAEITDIPGVLAYGKTEKEALANAYALALHVIADDIRESQEVPESINISRLSA